MAADDRCKQKKPRTGCPCGRCEKWSEVNLGEMLFPQALAYMFQVEDKIAQAKDDVSLAVYSANMRYIRTQRCAYILTWVHGLTRTQQYWVSVCREMSAKKVRQHQRAGLEAIREILEEERRVLDKNNLVLDEIVDDEAVVKRIMAAYYKRLVEYGVMEANLAQAALELPLKYE